MRVLSVPGWTVVLQAGAFAAMVLANYHSVPRSNTAQTHFDVLLVLGTPCAKDGKPVAELRERVLEGVREYQAHVAPRLIMSGGAAHNSFVEAHCMKQLAVEYGVPPSDVFEEDQAKDTIQNIWFSSRMMNAQGWRSAEVISSPSHLPRAALILSRYAFSWRTHAARWPPEYDLVQIQKLYWGEAKSCWVLSHRGFLPSRYLPEARKVPDAFSSER